MRYSLGLRLSLGYVLGLVSLAFDIHAPYSSRLHEIQPRLVGAECCCHLVTAVVCVLLPRRPNVYHNDIMVDRECSTSILSRATLSWGNKVVRLGHQGKELDLARLPGLDHGTRSQTLRQSFAEAKDATTTKSPCGCTMPAPMWKMLVQSNREHLLWTAVLCLLLALLSFTPHMALLRILQILESVSPEEKSSLQLGTWGVILGLAIVCSSAVEQWVNWIALNKISVQTMEQISIMVFD